MSGTYFCFSDECGQYTPLMDAEQCRIHPFYVRSTLLMNAAEWKSLNTQFQEKKKKFELPLDTELKWSDLWILKRRSSNEGSRKPLPSRLNGINYANALAFVQEALMLVKYIKERKVILTYTKNGGRYSTSEKDILRFHLQEHMQRIQMELACDAGNLGVLFIDPISNSKDKLLRELYFEYFQAGDFIEKYSCIKDSLNVENSHHSVGIQLADYISGCFNSVLKASAQNSYSIGCEMFLDSVYPNLRRTSSGDVHGWGIREVPRSEEARISLRGKLSELMI